MCNQVDLIDETNTNSVLLLHIFQLIAIQWWLNVFRTRATVIHPLTFTIVSILLEEQSNNFVATEIIFTHNEAFCKVFNTLTKFQGC